MKANPGGIITGNAIIDREKEVSDMWDILNRQSIVLISERRIGKTSILRKLYEHPINDWKPVLYFIEGKSHPIDFVEGLYDELIKAGIVESKFTRLKQLYKKYLGGEQIGSWKLPQLKDNWWNLYYSLIEDVVEAENKTLLIFDELPLMVHKILMIHGPAVATDFLDLLREVRNKYEGGNMIRFIFSGSIGLDIIIEKLKRDHKYVSDPINNMNIYPLGGMDQKGALLLCDKLTENEEIKLTDKDAVFNMILEKTNNLPFYIQVVFSKLYNYKEEVTPNIVEEIVTQLINDPYDPGRFTHYLDRIISYYNESIVPISIEILNAVSKSSDFISEEYIVNIVKQNQKFSNTENRTIKDVIETLRKDHYLIRNIKSEIKLFDFKYSLIKNWWKTNIA
jgi:hypothetical protein